MAMALVSSNATPQLASGRGEMWASDARKARYFSWCHPSSHASCTPWVREKGCSAEARQPHDAPGRELGPAGSGASPSRDTVLTAVNKPYSVLPSREQKAAGCWPAALALSLAAAAANSSALACTWKLVRVGERWDPSCSEVAMGGNLWAVVVHAPQHPAVLSLSSH